MLINQDLHNQRKQLEEKLMAIRKLFFTLDQRSMASGNKRIVI